MDRKKFLGVKAISVLNAFKIVEPPVSILDIISELGILYRETNNETDWSGALDNTRDPPVIWIRENIPEPNKRFIIAHELAHLLIHEQGILWRDVTFWGNKKETQANDWAAKLLAPENMILHSLANNKNVTIDELAKEYNVTPSLIEWRLRQLKFIM